MRSTPTGAPLSRRTALAAAGAVLTVSACGAGDAGDAEDDSGGGPGPEELVVGASLELTGAGAVLGVPQERALRITADGLNVDGVRVGNRRRTVRLVIRDNGSDAKSAAAVARQLTDQDNVHALIAGTLAETSLATVDVAQERQVPMISLAGADDVVLPLSRRSFIFKVTPDSVDVARSLAGEIRRQKHGRVAVLAVEGRYGDWGRLALTDALGAADREVVRTVRLPRRGDLTRPVRRAVDGSPDAVVVWAGAPWAGVAARALRAAGYDGPLFLDPNAVADDTLAGANAAAVEGAYVAHPAVLNSSSLTNTTTAGLARRDFIFRYSQRHGSFSGFAPYASDGLKLIANAARLARSVDRQRIRRFLETTAAEGIAGSYAFTPNSHGGMQPDSLALFRVTQGAWTRVS